MNSVALLTPPKIMKNSAVPYAKYKFQLIFVYCHFSLHTNVLS